METILSYYWLLEMMTTAILVYGFFSLIRFSYNEHSYLYQIDDKKKTVETWIQFLLPFIGKLKFKNYRHQIESKLAQVENSKKWNSSHFMASQMLIALMAAACLYFIIVIFLDKSILWVIALSSFVAILPWIKLTETARVRQKNCDRDLPYFIDFLTLCMGAGLDFNQALETVTSATEDTPLNREFKLVVKNIRLGMGRTDALLNMEKRMGVPSLKLFIQTLVQGIELGTDVVQTLEGLSKVFQNKKFQKAEESAGKISVQMMIPMMLFVMPAVMIVLLGPLALQYAQSL